MTCSKMKHRMAAAKLLAKPIAGRFCPPVEDGVARIRVGIGAMQVVVARLFRGPPGRALGRGRFTFLISSMPRNSCAHRPAGCAADCPDNLKQFGLLLWQALPIRAEGLDGDCVAAAKRHLRPESATGFVKVSNICSLHEWIADGVDSGNLNLGIYEKALIRSALAGRYIHWDLFVFGQEAPFLVASVFASGMPKERVASHRKQMAHF
jgi:hypothetical protein